MNNKSDIELSFPVNITLMQDKPHGKLDIETSTSINQTLSLFLDGLGSLLRMREMCDSFEFTDEQMDKLLSKVTDKVKELRNDQNQERVKITKNK